MSAMNPEPLGTRNRRFYHLERIADSYMERTTKSLNESRATRDSGLDFYVTERDLAATVIEAAEALGWKVFAVLDTRVPAKRTSKGWPDLVLVKGPEMIFAELKTQRGVVSSEQDGWLEALREVRRYTVALWRPSDMASIMERLRRKS